MLLHLCGGTLIYVVQYSKTQKYNFTYEKIYFPCLITRWYRNKE